MHGRRIHVCVTGGIAAYKAVEFVRALQKAGATVQVAMSANAQAFVGPLTFQAITHAPVLTRTLDPSEEMAIGHIAFAQECDLMAVVPATANILGKAANGLGDDVVSTVLLACDTPIVAAPAMNTQMWANPAVQANLATLAARGWHLVQPDAGDLACGAFGPGRLAEPAKIAEAVAAVLEGAQETPQSKSSPRSVPQPSWSTRDLPDVDLDELELDPKLGELISGDLARELGVVPLTRSEDGLIVATSERGEGLSAGYDALVQSSALAVDFVLASREHIERAWSRLYANLSGKHIVVSAGPTREPIDPVRFLSNPSTGRMGFAVASAAAARGARVTLVHGPVALEVPAGVDAVAVTTAVEMHQMIMGIADADAVVMTAAVADWRPAEVAAKKQAKDGAEKTLRLVRNPDILADLGARRKDRRPVLVGFAAETGDPVASAEAKRARKKVDLIVANDVSAAGSGFGTDTNQVWFVAETVEALPLMGKGAVAERIVDWVAERLK